MLKQKHKTPLTIHIHHKLFILRLWQDINLLISTVEINSCITAGAGVCVTKHTGRTVTVPRRQTALNAASSRTWTTVTVCFHIIQCLHTQRRQDRAASSPRVTRQRRLTRHRRRQWYVSRTSWRCSSIPTSLLLQSTDDMHQLITCTFTTYQYFKLCCL